MPLRITGGPAPRSVISGAPKPAIERARDSQGRPIRFFITAGQVRSELAALKEAVADLMLENRLLKKSMLGSRTSSGSLRRSAVPDRRGRKGSSEGLLPEDRLAWAREIWEERGSVVRLPGGPWMLREAAKVLSLPEEDVDRLLAERRKDTDLGG